MHEIRNLAGTFAELAASEDAEVTFADLTESEETAALTCADLADLANDDEGDS